MLSALVLSAGSWCGSNQRFLSYRRADKGKRISFFFCELPPIARLPCARARRSGKYVCRRRILQSNKLAWRWGRNVGAYWASRLPRQTQAMHHAPNRPLWVLILDWLAMMLELVLQNRMVPDWNWVQKRRHGQPNRGPLLCWHQNTPSLFRPACAARSTARPESTWVKVAVALAATLIPPSRLFGEARIQNRKANFS